jgi:LysM repeat protein
MGTGRKHHARKALALALAASTLAGGCGRSVRHYDEGELSDPGVREAMTRERRGDSEGAIRAYTRVLDRNPTQARAHLGLAFLLDKPDGDHVLAIYHYRRYLDLRPGTEKKELIENRMRMARQALATEAAPLPAAAADKVRALEAENARLKAEVRRLEESLATFVRGSGPPPPGPIASQGARSEVAVPPPRPAATTYIVQPGDNLSKIAARFYGDGSRWKDILAANTNVLRNAATIKVGQTLTIPP